MTEQDSTALQEAAPPETRRARPRMATVLSVIALITSVVAIGFSARTKSITAASAVPHIAVVENDFRIQATPTAVKGGLIDFTVANAGPSAHEFLIFRANQAPNALPTGSDGRVDESSDQITKVFDSGDNIAPRGSKVFHAALTPGTYVMVCNLPGHYMAGMHEAFTVH
jgi:uncharacterized cupredoxin-like copper-binding protein